MNDIFNIGFDERPDYQKIKFHLLKCILDINESPNKQFDWNKKYFREEQMELIESTDDTDNYDINDNEHDEMSDFVCVSDLMKG